LSGKDKIDFAKSIVGKKIKINGIPGIITKSLFMNDEIAVEIETNGRHCFEKV